MSNKSSIPATVSLALSGNEDTVTRVSVTLLQLELTPMSKISTAKTRISKKFFSQHHPKLQDVINEIEYDNRTRLTSVIVNQVPPNHWSISNIKPSEYHEYYLITPDGDIAKGKTQVLFSEQALALSLYCYKTGEEIAYLYSGRERPEYNDNQFSVGHGCYFIEKSLHNCWIYQVDDKFSLPG